MKNMRGIIDPYTLGFLLAIIGTIIIGTKMDNNSQANKSKSQVISSVFKQNVEHDLYIKQEK